MITVAILLVPKNLVYLTIQTYHDKAGRKTTNM